jgi:hypothetical protein
MDQLAFRVITKPIERTTSRRSSAITLCVWVWGLETSAALPVRCGPRQNCRNGWRLVECFSLRAAQQVSHHLAPVRRGSSSPAVWNACVPRSSADRHSSGWWPGPLSRGGVAFEQRSSAHSHSSLRSSFAACRNPVGSGSACLRIRRLSCGKISSGRDHRTTPPLQRTPDAPSAVEEGRRPRLCCSAVASLGHR